MMNSIHIFQSNLLIVDDQRPDILLLEQMLRGAGYLSVTSTMDSNEVCELHFLNHYDLILLDLQMPGLDGFQVMEQLRVIEGSGPLPVLVITAQEHHRVRALKAGAEDFICKPFNLPHMLVRVHQMLESRMLH